MRTSYQRILPDLLRLTLVCLAIGATDLSAQAAPRNHQYVNGHWFNGQTFVPQTMFVVAGRLRQRHAGPADSIIDLGGKYVIPPFAEAHNHHFLLPSGPFDAHPQIERYLREGIFYAKIPNVILTPFDIVRPLLNRHGSVDVAFSVAGLTGDGGHPVPLFESFASQGVIPGMTADAMPDQAFVAVDSPEELADKWHFVTAGKPDFIKVYLEHSEEFATRHRDPTQRGAYGIDPSLLPDIMRRARSAGLPVSAHVTTAADYRFALRAGVDEIYHLPLERITAACCSKQVPNSFSGPTMSSSPSSTKYSTSDALV